MVQRGGAWADCGPASPLPVVPNVTAHPSTANVPITVLLYDGPLLCGFNVAINELTTAQHCQCLCAVAVCEQYINVLLSLPRSNDSRRVAVFVQLCNSVSYDVCNPFVCLQHYGNAVKLPSRNFQCIAWQRHTIKIASWQHPAMGRWARPFDT